MAEARIVFEGAEILARRSDHRLGLDAELGEAVVGAYAVDGERAIVVAGEGAAGNEVHDETLQPRGKIRQSDNPLASTGELRNQIDDLAQCVHPRSAKLVSVSAG